MAIREDTDGSLLPTVSAANRALVFLTVPWSTPERRARLAFREAAEELACKHPNLGVECFSLDEDAAWCQAWLENLGVPQLGRGYPLGSGSMVWLEAGRVVCSEVGGCSLRSMSDIVARSLALWGS
jgi:hypothetical protein